MVTMDTANVMYEVTLQDQPLRTFRTLSEAKSWAETLQQKQKVIIRRTEDSKIWSWVDDKWKPADGTKVVKPAKTGNASQKNHSPAVKRK